MKIVKYSTVLLCVFVTLTGYTSFAQQADKANDKAAKEIKTNDQELNTYLIEREIPDAGKFTPEQLKGISQKSCAVIKELGPEIVWLHSYVTENKIYCVYKAKDEKIIREHAAKGGFPVNAITKLSTVISPETAK